MLKEDAKIKTSYNDNKVNSIRRHNNTKFVCT